MARLFETGAILILCSPIASMANAQTFQMECRFENFIRTTSQGVDSGEVFWKVIMAHTRTSGRVVVDGSGDYKAKAKSFASGAIEYKFNTDVSDEVITVGPTGEALWDIRFDGGDILVYTGECNEQRRTD